MQTMRADLRNATWRKSTYSNGQADCLEIADDIPIRDWRKSTYSDTVAECIEVADNIPGGRAAIAIRDSKRPSGPALLLPHAAWADFIRSL